MSRQIKKLVEGVVILLLALALVLTLGRHIVRSEEEKVDPHEGQVLINDGYNDVWITPIEGIEVNELKEDDFEKTDGRVVYTGEDYDTVLGVDVSEHQHYIDWEAVAQSGVKFAYVRCGYRGYTQGGLNEDPWFRTNIDGARDAGLDVGVYFFSQAINVAEAIHEARFVLRQIEGYDVTLPVMYDWEKLENIEDARTNDLDPSIIGDCGVAFCETIRAAGYDAGIYFNRQLGYYSLDLSRLKDVKFWLAVPGDYPDFYYAGNIWQYTHEGEVPGIEGEVDMNLMFTKRPEPTPEPEASPTP
ncbi:MAG: glycoside hydrolase family 25 protein [Oscillospiraceae bacterium]|nr:glycoside hydrolase family 25 protein [Ruminococcus sp.]MBQ7472858.1 glycoside hydrolase family 25 protein [Oscillospiraceae bacterium]